MTVFAEFTNGTSLTALLLYDINPLRTSQMWKVITGEEASLETIFETWEADVAVEEACNTPDPADGNTALHKAAIAAKPEMVT